MDHTKLANGHEPEVIISDTEIKKAKEIILTAIDNNNGAFINEINRESNGRVSAMTISKALNILISERVIRQKEDLIEHDWEYLRVRA